MINTLFLLALVAASQSPSGAISADPNTGLVYREHGEWETVTEVVDLVLPESSAEEKELILKLYREKFGAKTTTRHCLDTIAIADYPQVGDELDLMSAGICVFQKVEQPGEPVERIGICTGENLESTIHITGYHTSNKYEYLTKMIATSGSAVSATAKETGTLIGPCTSASEKE